MTAPLAIVLAAGKGTRMNSELPKVLVPVLGRPMVEYVIEALTAAGVGRIVIVIGYQADLMRETLSSWANVTFVEQKQQLGTGHAVMVCRDILTTHDGPVVVVTGDSPLIQSGSLQTLLAEFEKQKPAALLGTVNKPDPHGLGRIVRDAAGGFSGIVEEKDATPEQKQITEVNLSCYVFDCRELLATLARLGNKNAQGEYYLTDCPGQLKQSGKKVLALPILKPCEALSINTMAELGLVEVEMRKQGHAEVK